MSVLQVNKNNFSSEIINSEKPVLIDFYADWCGPCKMLSPIIDEIARSNSDVKVVKINIDKEPDLANRYDVMSIPTLVLVNSGKIINRSVGLQPKENIMKMISHA